MLWCPEHHRRLAQGSLVQVGNIPRPVLASHRRHLPTVLLLVGRDPVWRRLALELVVLRQVQGYTLLQVRDTTLLLRLPQLTASVLVGLEILQVLCRVLLQVWLIHRPLQLRTLQAPQLAIPATPRQPRASAALQFSHQLTYHPVCKTSNRGRDRDIIRQAAGLVRVHIRLAPRSIHQAPHSTRRRGESKGREKDREIASLLE